MDTNVVCNDKNIALCAIPKLEELKQCSTIGRLLKELKIILQKELANNPTSEATTEFQKNLTILDKEYKDDVPKIVDDYQQEYSSLVREKLLKAEEKYKKLVNWSDDNNNPGHKLREAITELREKFYNDVEDCLKVKWDSAREEFKNGQCCRDQALERKKITEKKFEDHKKFKERVNNWFKNLDNIYKEAEALLELENYKALYAYRLEFHSILCEVRQLKQNETTGKKPNVPVAKDSKWLKNALTECLRDSCLATYEYFYWQQNWIELTEQEKKAAEQYHNFQNMRMDDFIREAQDIELTEDSEGCYDEPHRTYKNTVAV